LGVSHRQTDTAAALSSRADHPINNVSKQALHARAVGQPANS
jgi:hypothetical protein